MVLRARPLDRAPEYASTIRTAPLGRTSGVTVGSSVLGGKPFRVTGLADERPARVLVDEAEVRLPRREEIRVRDERAAVVADREPAEAELAMLGRRRNGADAPAGRLLLGEAEAAAVVRLEEENRA